MMKHILIASMAVGIILGFAAPSNAAPNTANYFVDGNVPQICTVGLPQLLNDTAPINVTNITGESIQITQLTDPTTLAAKAASFDVGFPTSCNFAHRLVVESQNNGLWADELTPPAPGFADAVPYTAQIIWGPTNTQFQATAVTKEINNVSIPVNTPAQGNIELRFQVLAGASNAQSFAPLLAGTYRDIIRVTVQPQ